MVAVATEVLARRPTAATAAASGKVQLETAAAIRNSEVIAASGMLPDVARRGRRAQAESIRSLEDGRTASKALSGAAKGLRLALEIGIIAAGAVRVIERAASVGTIIASAVVLARVLMPFEQLIDGWRQWVDALATLERLRGVSHGYETRRADAGTRLSGGQRQRIALARAVFGEPKLLVLDEPNSNLDAEGEAALVEALETMRRCGATIVVAQRMSIPKRADRLLILKDGAVAQFGGRSTVLATLAPQRPTRGPVAPPLRETAT